MALHTRRRLLGGLAAGALVGTAGCLRRAQERLTSVDVPEAGPPTYRKWLPAPSALPDDEDDYGVHYLRMPDVLGDETTVRAGISPRNLNGRTGRDPIGIDDQRIEEIVKVGLLTATVLIGSFDADSAGRNAAGIGYERSGSDGDFDVYEHPDRNRAIAASDGAVIHSHGGEAPRAVIDAVLDARRGDAERYHEVDSTVAELTAAAGSPTFVWLLVGSGPNSIERVSDTASTMQFEGDSAYYRIHHLFEDADAASPEAVREQLSNGALPRTAPLDVEAEGRRVTAEYVRGLDSLADEGYELYPLVAWRFDYEAESGELTITHRVGDAVDAEALTVEDTADSDPFDARFSDEHDVVEPGDAITVDVDAGTDVRIMWRTGNSGSRVGQYRVPAPNE